MHDFVCKYLSKKNKKKARRNFKKKINLLRFILIFFLFILFFFQIRNHLSVAKGLKFSISNIFFSHFHCFLMIIVTWKIVSEENWCKRFMPHFDNLMIWRFDKKFSESMPTRSCWDEVDGFSGTRRERYF